MPYRLEFDSANRILRSAFEGVVSDEELKNFYFEVPKHVARHAPQSAVIDFSGVKSFEAAAETIRGLANLPPAIQDPAIPRCLIAPTPKMFGLARMFELQGQETRPSFHVVHSEREAWAILGVKNPQFEPIEGQ